MSSDEYYDVLIGSTKYTFYPERNEVTINDLHTKSYVLLPSCGDLLIFNIKDGELRNAKVYTRGTELSRALVAKVIERTIFGNET